MRIARFVPSPAIIDSSAADAVRALSGVPNFFSIRTAVLSPTPGKEDRSDYC